MEAFAYGLSVFIGLISGVIVSLAVEAIKELTRYKKEVKNLQFEVQCNIAKLNKWLKDLDDLSNKINSDRIIDFTGYFNLSLVLLATAIRMLQSGSLYKCISKDNIEKLQEIGNYLNLQGENVLNNQINMFKQDFMHGVFDKVSAARWVDTWKNVLTTCKNNFESIANELSTKKG